MTTCACQRPRPEIFISQQAMQAFKRPERRSCEHGIAVAVFAQIPTAAATHQADHSAACDPRGGTRAACDIMALTRSPSPLGQAPHPVIKIANTIHFTCKLGRQICVLEACPPLEFHYSVSSNHGCCRDFGSGPPPLPVNLSAMPLHHVDLPRALQIHLGNVVPFQSYSRSA